MQQAFYKYLHMSGSDEEKTEEPTHKRLEDARKKGQSASSKEVANFFMIFTLCLLVIMVFPGAMERLANSMAEYFTIAATFSGEPGEFEEIGKKIAYDILSTLAVPFVLFVCAAIASSLLQNGFNLSVEPIMPKFEKISLRKGFSRMFSRRSFMEFLKGLVKIIIVGIVAYYSVSADIPSIGGTQETEVQESMGIMSALCHNILISVTIAVFFIAVFDFMFQKLEFLKQMRMSKHEIKEEYKQQEGDPKIKGKLRQLRMQRARNRMMAAVPTADVIVTNPTHYAVALKYEQTNTSAPIVIAMGTDKVAERIKAMAEENDIPIVRNPTLARALYAECDLEQEIPFDHYQAVAEIISYIYKMKRGGR